MDHIGKFGELKFQSGVFLKFRQQKYLVKGYRKVCEFGEILFVSLAKGLEYVNLVKNYIRKISTFFRMFLPSGKHTPVLILVFF